MPRGRRLTGWAVRWPGRWPGRAGRQARRSAKNSRSRAPHSPARIPPTTSARWLSLRSRRTSHNEPAAPAFGSAAPYTTRSIRAATTAPAHMVHGSSVTTRVQPSRRQDPSARAAARMATISACAVGSASDSRWLCARAIGAPAGSRMTAPTGTSPRGEPDPAASASAARIADSKAARKPVLTEARLPPECLVQGPVQGVTEPELAGDDGQRLVGKQVQVAREHPQIHLVDAEVGEDGQVAGGQHLIEVLVFRQLDLEVAEYLVGERPVQRRGEIGEKHRHLAADHP